MIPRCRNRDHGRRTRNLPSSQGPFSRWLHETARRLSSDRTTSMLATTLVFHRTTSLHVELPASAGFACPAASQALVQLSCVWLSTKIILANATSQTRPILTGSKNSEQILQTDPALQNKTQPVFTTYITVTHPFGCHHTAPLGSNRFPRDLERKRHFRRPCMGRR